MSERFCWQPSCFAAPDPQLAAESLPLALDRAWQFWPDRAAVASDEGCFTFRDLARRAAGLAEEIRASSTPPGPVALVQSAGLDAVAAWFACALAGRPFVLLEPSHPSLRLRELIAAASATLVICDPGTCRQLPDDMQVARLQSDGRSLPWLLRGTLEPDEPAMVFPTSGSTGMPKLVTYSSRTLQVKVQSSRSLMRIPPEARVLIAGSHGNFGFLHHALVFLLSGGTLCLADLQKGGFKAILSAITERGARHVRFTPSLFRSLAVQPETHGALRCLQAVRFSGEPLLKSDLELARSLLDPDCLVQNVYGSTESSLFIWSLGEEMDTAAATVPIGRVYPHSAYALRLLEESHGDPDTGELVLRSAFHALGDLTGNAVDAARFPPDPLSSAERIYATGDVVRRLPGGGLVMLGRSTRMVKVRGQRVFLTEVENHLRAIPGVAGAAAVSRDDGHDTAIYAFVTGANGVEASLGARTWLEQRLPAYMVPRQVLFVETIPMLPGGKVDYAALARSLPEIDAGPVSTLDGESGLARLSRVWRSVLGWAAQDPQNDFFALGGDSLKEMLLALAVEREFGRAMSTEAFRADPTLNGLAVAFGLAAAEDVKPARRSGLTFRPFCPARAPSRGVSLAMPGWLGSAIAAPFHEPGLFADHDMWCADVPLVNGNLLEEGRWWRAATDVAARIKETSTPAPDILFGYSIGGAIAWLVGRLLAGTPQCPTHVVMIDAVPLHRLAGAGCEEACRHVCGSDAGGPLPAALHIRRAPLEVGGVSLGSSGLWQPEDNIVDTLDLQTVDHYEMIRPDVLRLAVPFLSQRLSRPSGETRAISSGMPLETPGGQLHRMLGGATACDASELDSLLEAAGPYLSAGCLDALVHLVVRDGRPDQQQKLIDLAPPGHPGVRLLRDAMQRGERPPEVALVIRPDPARHHHASDILGATPSTGPRRLKAAIRRWLGG